MKDNPTHGHCEECDDACPPMVGGNLMLGDTGVFEIASSPLDRRVLAMTNFLVITLIIAFLSIGFLFSPKPVLASCQCIASGSAKLATTSAQWKTLNDGGAPCDYAGKYAEGASCNPYTESYVNLWFCVPTVPELLGNIVRIIFFVAGILALFMLLFGGFEWVSSGGDDKKIQSAQARMRAAVIGLVVMVASLTLVVVVEQVIFGGKICLGISCPLDMGKIALIENTTPGGRRQCFDRSSPIAPTGVASPSGVLRVQIATPSATMRPSSLAPSKRQVIIVTATPGPALRVTVRPINPNVTVYPYGSKIPTPTKVRLPGTGGGGGPVLTEPPVTQF